MKRITNWEPCSTRHFDLIYSFLKDMDKEGATPLSSFPQGIKGIIDLGYEKGVLMLGKVEGVVVGFATYTIGDPINNFKEKDLGYLYLLVIAPKFRRNPAFARSFLKRFTLHMDWEGLTTIKFKAHKKEAYLNNLYSKIANIEKGELNAQGQPCWKYVSSVNNWKEKFLIRSGS